MSILEHIKDFWASYGEWMTIALIPTIIAGLTISPRTAPAAHWVGKIWDGVKILMNFLSVLTHKDQPGTFKLPLTTSTKKLEEKTGTTEETK